MKTKLLLFTVLGVLLFSSCGKEPNDSEGEKDTSTNTPTLTEVQEFLKMDLDSGYTEEINGTVYRVTKLEGEEFKVGVISTRTESNEISFIDIEIYGTATPLKSGDNELVDSLGVDLYNKLINLESKGDFKLDGINYDVVGFNEADGLKKVSITTSDLDQIYVEISGSEIIYYAKTNTQTEVDYFQFFTTTEFELNDTIVYMDTTYVVEIIQLFDQYGNTGVYKIKGSFDNKDIYTVVYQKDTSIYSIKFIELSKVKKEGTTDAYIDGKWGFGWEFNSIGKITAIFTPNQFYYNDSDFGFQDCWGMDFIYN